MYTSCLNCDNDMNFVAENLYGFRVLEGRAPWTARTMRPMKCMLLHLGLSGSGTDRPRRPATGRPTGLADRWSLPELRPPVRNNLGIPGNLSLRWARSIQGRLFDDNTVWAATWSEGFVKCFLKVQLACLGSMAAVVQTNGLCNSYKTLYKTFGTSCRPRLYLMHCSSRNSGVKSAILVRWRRWERQVDSGGHERPRPNCRWFRDDDLLRQPLVREGGVTF